MAEYGINVYHRETCKLEMSVLILFCSLFLLFFLGMNEVSLLYLILSLRAFWKLKVAAWAL